jgi:3-oxoacyl-[acyl-carrier protein] reductase
MKTILITGSSRGIGRAIALLARKEGYKVIVHGREDSAALRKTHKEIRGSIKTFFDVGDKEETHKKIKNLISKYGCIDALVNNAGVARNFIKDISEVDEKKALEEWRTNVLGTIHCTQAVLPAMLKKGRGSVVNIASIKGYPNLATMSTFTFAQTKSAIISMTKSLAKIYSPKGVRFNAVAPGYTETDQVKLWDEDTFKRIKEGTLLSRMAKPEEIAEVVMFLASDKASYVTGSLFLADGGYTLKGK